MSIILPSKNIYKIENPKVVDNEINSVEYIISKGIIEHPEQQQVFENSYSTVLDEGTFPAINSEFDMSNFQYSFTYSRDVSTSKYNFKGSASGYKDFYFYTTLEIPKNNNFNYVANPLEVKVKRITKKRECEVRVVLQNPQGAGSTQPTEVVQRPTVLSVVSEEDNVEMEKVSNSSEEGIGTIYASLSDNGQRYIINLKINSGGYKYSGSHSFSNAIINTPQQIGITSTMIEYQPKQVDVEILGNVYSFTFEETTAIFSNGVGDKKTSIDSNALMQSKYKSEIESKLQQTINSYANGKENAQILCSIGEYYDENGDSVISTQTADKMTFNLYDEVVPMINSPLNFDVPMSLTDDLMPKTFAVLGSKINFDGAVWQTLYLQEKGKLENTYFLNGSDNIIYEPSQDFSEFICSGVKNDNTVENAIIASNVNGLSVTSIKNNAFENNNTLKSITISENIEYIGDYAFANCLINSIKLPTTIKQIGASAFENCTNFKNIVLQNKIEFIGQSAFKNTYLFDFAMPNDLQSIEAYSFSQTPLKAISIGKNVKYIAEGAFSNCTDLKTIVVSPSTISIAENAFEGTNANINIIIQGEQGEIQGAPWGATGNVNIHYLPKDIKGEYAVFCKTDTNLLEKCLAFNIKGYGKGKVYVNNELVFEEDLTDNSEFYYAYGGYALVSFEGNFTEISPQNTEVSADDIRNYQNILAILKWNNTELYKNMFRRNDFINVPIEIPSNYNVLPEGCFEKTKLYRLTIPQNIKKIDYNALAFEYCVELIFLHDKNDFITLDKEIAYSKYARQINIYTDNTIIKNYDWSGNNIGATFYHIDGSEWK